jgi:hypothetical protein
MFGDNKMVVKSATLPQLQLGKQHHALAYHFTREAIAAKIVVFNHIPSELNVADILSKKLGTHSQVYTLLKPVLFYQGDTLDLIKEEAAN